MKIKLLSSALENLYDGRLFYEKQGEGLGEYFYNSLFSDIDSLTLAAGIRPKFFGYYRMPFITNYKKDLWLWYGEFLICDVIQRKYDRH